MPEVKNRGGDLASARPGATQSQPQKAVAEDESTTFDRISGSALQHVGTCCRSRPLPAHSVEREQRVRELLIKFEREFDKFAVNDGNWYGSGIPIRILRKDPQRCQYNPPSQPQPDGSAAGDRMDSEDNDSNIPSASGGGECSSSYGYEAYQGKVKEKGRAGSTSSKPYPSLETKHHAEGDREEGDRGGEPEVVEQADFVRKMEQEGRGSEDAVCRNDADTDVPIISQPRHSRHAGGDIDDEVELTDFSITSRKRFRESAGRAQDQADSGGGAVEGVLGERATCDAADRAEELVESRVEPDEPSSPPRKRANAVQGSRSSKRKTSQPKMSDDQDEEYSNSSARNGDFDPNNGLPAKRRPPSTRAASLRSSAIARPPPPPTTMEKPLEILSDDEVKAEDGDGANPSVGSSGNRASGKLQQQPAALASPHDDGDKMDSGLVATDFGDGILGVRTRKERVGAIPGIRKVHLSWGTGYFNQRSIRPVPHETRLFFPDKGAQGAVEVTRLDVIRLYETVFLNDTLIDFYFRYLLSKPESFGGELTASQVHVFSPLFVQAITNAANSSRSDAYHRIVKKWTKGLDLFSKKFVFFPINSCLHWSLVILCNPDRFTATRQPESSNPPLATGLPTTPSIQHQQQKQALTDVDDTPNAPASPSLEQGKETPMMARVPFGQNKRSTFMTQTEEEVGGKFGHPAAERVSNDSIYTAPPPKAATVDQAGVTRSQVLEPCSDEGNEGWPESQALAKYNHQVEGGGGAGGEGSSTWGNDEDGYHTELDQEQIEDPELNDSQMSDGQPPSAESALHDEPNEQEDVLDDEEGQPKCSGKLVGGGKPGRQSKHSTGSNSRCDSSSAVVGSAVEDLTEIDGIEDQNNSEVDSPNPQQDEANGQQDDSSGLTGGRYSAGAELLKSPISEGTLTARLPFQVREPATACAHITRGGRREQSCRPSHQTVNAPRCSLQGLPASRAGLAKRPLRIPVQAKSGRAGDSSSAEMVDLTTPTVENVPESVDIDPKSTKPRWSALHDSVEVPRDDLAVLPAGHSVQVSPGHSQTPSRSRSPACSVQHWTANSPERSLNHSPALEGDEANRGAGNEHDRKFDLGYPSDGYAAGRASGSSWAHDVSPAAVGNNSNNNDNSDHNHDNDNSNAVSAIEEVDTMDILLKTSADQVLPDTVAASAAHQDARDTSRVSPDTRAPDILDTAMAEISQQHGFQNAKTTQDSSDSQPVAPQRNLRRVCKDHVDIEDSRGEKAGYDEEGVGKEAERTEAENEEIPCMFMLDSTRGHRSQEVFKIVRKYVEAAWNDSRRESIGEADVSSRTLPGCSPPVPQQSNDCDCGVYVIHYTKLFLETPPVVTRGVFAKSGRSVFSKKWFKESDIIQERRDMRNTIERLRWKAIQQQRTSSSI